MTGVVLHQKLLSNVFAIRRGTRQGGILSPWLYLVYINDLLVELSSSAAGLEIFGSNFSCPSQADDIVLMSLSKDGLVELLNICFEFSEKWKFKYNADKCKIIVFNESKV